MKILFVNNSHLDTNSGIHIRNLANNLSRLGVQCTVCVPTQEDAIKEIGSVMFDVIAFPEVCRNYRKQKYDIIHAWTPRELVRSMTEKLAGIYQCPYIVHLEDNEEALLEAFIGRPISELSHLSSKQLENLIPPHLSHPIKYKEFLQNALGITVIMDTLLEFCPKNIPSEVIWAGYEESMPWGMQMDFSLRTNMKILSSDRVIVYTGNIHLANRAEVFSLYLAVGLLNRRGIKTWLVRTGIDYVRLIDPWLNELNDYCINIGHVPRQNLPAILSIADVLVQPGKNDAFNKYRFPAKLPEFLVTGRPVILPATNIGRFMKDGEECILLQKGNALEIAQKLEMLFQDRILCEKIGEGGRSFAQKNLKWSRSAENLNAFYQSLFAKIKI